MEEEDGRTWTWTSRGEMCYRVEALAAEPARHGQNAESHGSEYDSPYPFPSDNNSHHLLWPPIHTAPYMTYTFPAATSMLTPTRNIFLPANYIATQ
jgi:hypothetical protein